MTGPEPVRLRDDLALGIHEGRHRTLAVLVLGTAADAGERRDTVVDDDPDLLVGETVTGQN